MLYVYVRSPPTVRRADRSIFTSVVVSPLNHRSPPTFSRLGNERLHARAGDAVGATVGANVEITVLVEQSHGWFALLE